MISCCSISLPQAKNFHLLEIVRAHGRHPSKEAHPAGVAPGQHDEALVEEFSPWPGASSRARNPSSQLLEHQRHVLKAAIDGSISRRPTTDSSPPLQLADTHAAHHVGLAALAAVGIDQVLVLLP